MCLCNGKLLFIVYLPNLKRIADGGFFAFFLNRALDSMAAGKRLSESRFSVVNLYAPNQKSLGLMLSGDDKGDGSSSL